MVFDLNNIRSRRNAAPPPRQPLPVIPRPTPATAAKPAAELPAGATAERRPLPAPTGGVRRAGPTLIRGWSPIHLAAFAALLAISLVCGGIVYGELSDTAAVTIAGGPEPVAPSATPVPPAPESAFVMAPLETYGEVTARPLFSATRRPAATARQAAAPMSSFALAGVVISRDGRVALIRQGKTPGLIRVREGQQVEGWIVRSIAEDRVVVSNGAADSEIKLHEDASAGRAGAAQAPR